MTTDDRRSLEERVALLEAVVAAAERPHEVLDAIVASRDDTEADERLRLLLDLPATTPPQVVRDLQLGRLVGQHRDALRATLAEARDALDDD